jgi:hypothetical protein
MKTLADRRAAQLSAYKAVKQQRKDNREREECVVTPEFREKNQAVINGIVSKIIDLLDDRIAKGKNSINISYALGSHISTEYPLWMYWNCVRYILDRELGYTVGEDIYAVSYAVFVGTAHVRMSVLCEDPCNTFSVKL